MFSYKFDTVVTNSAALFELLPTNDLLIFPQNISRTKKQKDPIDNLQTSQLVAYTENQHHALALSQFLTEHNQI